MGYYKNQDLIDREAKVRSVYTENNELKDYIKKLEQEIDILRQFGNKDCTAMADNYLAKEVKR